MSVRLSVYRLEERVNPVAVTAITPVGPAVTGGGPVSYDVTFDGPVSGLTAADFAPSSALPTDTRPHQSYDQLLGPLPSPLSADILDYPDRLADARLAQVPLTRGKEYHVSPTGDDRDGDGSVQNPWASIVPVNRMLTPDISFDTDGRAFAAADASAFRFGGDRSWTAGGWVNVGYSFQGNVLVSPGGWTVSTNYWVGYGVEGPPYASATVGGQTHNILWPTGIRNTGWRLVIGSYNHLTHTLSLSVDLAAPVSIVLPAAPDAGTGPLTANGMDGAAYVGQTARLFVAADTVLSAADRATLYNAGRGLRYPAVPTALKRRLSSWWEMDRPAGQLGYTVFPDSRGVTPLIASATGGGNATGLDADSPISAEPGGRQVGGADLAIAFQRGGVYRTPVGHTLAGGRSGITLKDYGDPALPPPVLSEFSVTYSASGWKSVGGGVYRRQSVDVAWLKRVGDDRPPFAAPLTLARDPAAVQATPNSFCWAGGFLYLNVGDNPAVVSPAGWVAVPWTGTATAGSASPQLVGDNIRVHGLAFEGGGLSRPGTSSGYGLQLFVDVAGGEVAVTDSRFFYTGYHALGVIGRYGIRSTTRGNRAGYLSARNPEPTTGPREDTVTHYVTYVGYPGDNEVLSVGDEAYGGVLPDWTGAAPGGVGGDAFFAHDGPYKLYLVSRFKVTGTPHGRPLRGVASGNTDAPTLDAVRALVIGTTTNISGFDLLAVSAGAALVNVVNPTPVPVGTVGFIRSIGARGDGAAWLINCGTVYDLAAAGASVSVYGNLPPTAGVRERWLNSSLLLANAGTRPVQFSYAGASDHTFDGCVLSVDGTGPVSLGVLPAANVRAGATYRVPATGGVVLSRAPGLLELPDATLVVGGPPDGPEYDQTGAYRGGLRTVGPVAAGSFPYPARLAGVTVTAVAPVGGNTVWRVTLAGGSGSGRLGVRLLRSLGLVDVATNLPFDSGFVRVDRDPPAVRLSVVNDGTIQRSRVTAITLSFSEAVSFQDQDATAAVSLTGPAGTVAVRATWVPGHNALTLTFPESADDFGSLADGRYEVALLGDRVRDAAGNPLPPPPPVFVHRLFGDVTGDAAVDGGDLAAMRTAFGTFAGRPGYRADLDFNADDAIDGADLAAFRKRFGLSLP